MPSSRASEDRQHRRAGGTKAGSERAERRAIWRPSSRSMEDRYKRALADLDNYRKRVGARDRAARGARAARRLLRDWLEAVDSVERALLHAARRTRCVEGLRAVLEQMEAVLARQGVSASARSGSRSTPSATRRSACATTDEAPDRTVVDVARSGFALGDRVLRPAQVVVSRREAGGD